MLKIEMCVCVFVVKVKPDNRKVPLRVLHKGNSLSFIHYAKVCNIFSFENVLSPGKNNIYSSTAVFKIIWFKADTTHLS